MINFDNAIHLPHTQSLTTTHLGKLVFYHPLPPTPCPTPATSCSCSVFPSSSPTWALYSVLIFIHSVLSIYFKTHTPHSTLGELSSVQQRKTYQGKNPHYHRALWVIKTQKLQYPNKEMQPKVRHMHVNKRRFIVFIGSNAATTKSGLVFIYLTKIFYFFLLSYRRETPRFIKRW